jgi:hypothetical protein
MQPVDLLVIIYVDMRSLALTRNAFHYMSCVVQCDGHVVGVKCDGHVVGVKCDGHVVGVQCDGHVVGADCACLVERHIDTVPGSPTEKHFRIISPQKRPWILHTAPPWILHTAPPTKETTANFPSMTKSTRQTD